MTHMLEGRLKGVVEEAKKERDLKEVSEANLRELGATLAASKRRAEEAERAYAAVEKRPADLEGKLGKAEVWLAQADSVISARDKEVANLKEAVVESKDKFYNMGFADAENSSKPIMLESWHYGFGEGWMAAMNALGLPEDSPFKDTDKIPYLEPLPPPFVQDPTQNKEEDSLSMRKLVEEIDSHIEVIKLEISSNLATEEGQII